MNQFNQSQINEQFANTTRQFTDTASQVNRLTLENAQNVFGLQLAAIQQNVNATFAYLGELAEVRDLDGLKSVLPKGMQVARENVERSISVGQEVLGRTVKTNEAIGQIAKSQIQSATAKVQAETETVVNRASEQVRSNLEAVNKASKQK